MPKAKQKPRKRPAKKAAPDLVPTIEVDGYLVGIFHELKELAAKYSTLAEQRAQIEARIELTEGHLRTTRDHLMMAIREADGVTVPRDWTTVLKNVQFVGLRLADACVILLKAEKRMSPEHLLVALNHGMFRFRTNAPLREIHAALLRHPSIERADGVWVWTGDQPSLPMPRKVVDNTTVVDNARKDAAESA